jgi:hypothetical protein
MDAQSRLLLMLQAIERMRMSDWPLAIQLYHYPAVLLSSRITIQPYN